MDTAVLGPWADPLVDVGQNAVPAWSLELPGQTWRVPPVCIYEGNAAPALFPAQNGDPWPGPVPYQCARPAGARARERARRKPRGPSNHLNGERIQHHGRYRLKS